MAQVVRIAPAPAAYAEAVDRYLGSAGVAESSRRVYRISLTTWAWLLAGANPPAQRRSARPPDVL
jgi:integrase/recombinase XerD